MRQFLLGGLVAACCTACVAPILRSTASGTPTPGQSAELWESPSDLAGQNLFDGPWGKELAPDPDAIYAFVSAKSVGISPGYAVVDPQGREWSVKQGPEAKVEVVVSRVLSALGYHQPPVYYLPRWTLASGRSRRIESEARFRPKHAGLKDDGEWSWQANPFVGTRPFDGLRVLMLILNESDLKNSNNTLYAVAGSRERPTAPRRWYVVRDIGTALGETGRLDPKRSDNGKFERTGFITGVTNGSVDFDYDGRHQELAAHISPDDVRWMCGLLSQLTVAQWRDAFRAGGYDMATGDRFIARLTGKIAEGRALAP
ncbi:MAG TPA: hypothetical protein VIW45_07555 [Vicinamibacterales bacterium]